MPIVPCLSVYIVAEFLKEFVLKAAVILFRNISFPFNIF
jgi:hypothetical protein